jgi:hypothetical protein
MNKEIVMRKDLIGVAFEAYGECIGSKYCFDKTVFFMMEKYELSEDEAKEIVSAAYKEWLDAYE